MTKREFISQLCRNAANEHVRRIVNSRHEYSKYVYTPKRDKIAVFAPGSILCMYDPVTKTIASFAKDVFFIDTATTALAQHRNKELWHGMKIVAKWGSSSKVAEVSTVVYLASVHILVTCPTIQSVTALRELK